MTGHNGILMMLGLQLIQITSSYCMEEPALKRRKIDNPNVAVLLKDALSTGNLNQLKNAIREADGDIDRLISVDPLVGQYVGDTMLGHAVRLKQVAFVDYLIQQAARVDKLGEFGRTALVILVASDWHHSASIRIMDRLLEAGASVNERDVYGFFPIHYMALKRSSSVGIKLLVERGAHADQRNTFTGKTPLHLAIDNDCHDTVHTLIELGASPFAKDNAGESPVALAKRTNKQGIIGDYARTVDWIETGNE